MSPIFRPIIRRHGDRRRPASRCLADGRGAGDLRVSGRDRLQLAFDPPPALHQIEVALKAEEESLRQAKVSRQMQIGVRRHRPLAVHQLVDAPGRHAGRTVARAMRPQLTAAETVASDSILEIFGGSLAKKAEDWFTPRKPHKREIVPKLAVPAVRFLGELLQII